MFLVLAFVPAIAVTILDYLFFIKKKTFGEYVRVLIRNSVVITLVSLAFQKYFLHYAHFLDTTKYHTKQFVHFGIVSVLVAVLLDFLFAFVQGMFVFESDDFKTKKGRSILRIVGVVLVFLGSAALFGTIWGRSAFGEVSGDQLIINLTSPTEGTEASVYRDGFEGPVFNTLLVTSLYSLFVFAPFKINYLNKEKVKTVFSVNVKRIACFVLSIVMLVMSINYGVQQFKLDKVFKTYVIKSDIIDSNYVDPRDTKVTFPEKKRNLIHIYLESMELSYLSRDLGGNMGINLIPNLTKLADEGVVFSDSDKKFGGPRRGPGTQWSIASMVNENTGLPMKAPGMHNGYGAEGNFLPGAYTLGEMLEKEGYEQTFIVGSDTEFGGLKYFYQTHGNWKIIDLMYAREHNMLPSPNYKEWWGFEDDKLYEFTKEELTRLSKTGKPFNLTIENADTHRPGGYVTPGKKCPFKGHYANAIWNSDRDVQKLIEWIKAQPFYENTTVILVGDHKSMETDFFRENGFTKDYYRTTYNLILNPDPSVANPSDKITKNREWSNWDYFPTIVASLGGKIDGERLGIGTNLFSGKKTLYEEKGVEYVNEELEKKSVLYNDKILEGKAKDAGRQKSAKKSRIEKKRQTA